MSDAPPAGDDGPEPEPSSAPEPDVFAVWREHETAIKNAEMPTERIDAARPVFEEMAKAEVVAGEEVNLWIEELASIDRLMTKTTIRTEYESVRADVREELADDVLADDATPLDAWLESHVETVVKHTSTDAHADAEYRWHLADGREFATDGDTHFRWQTLRKVIFNSIGARPTKPDTAESEAWADWMMAFIEERVEVQTRDGPRTQAINKLADQIHRATAYGTPSDSITRGPGAAVWMDAPDADTVHVSTESIRGIADEFGLSHSALQNELDARGLRNGQSRPVALDDGRRFRFWPISTELAEPHRWKPEHESPFERGGDPEPATDDTDADA